MNSNNARDCIDTNTLSKKLNNLKKRLDWNTHFIERTLVGFKECFIAGFTAEALIAFSILAMFFSSILTVVTRHFGLAFLRALRPK